MALKPSKLQMHVSCLFLVKLFKYGASVSWNQCCPLNASLTMYLSAQLLFSRLGPATEYGPLLPVQIFGSKRAAFSSSYHACPQQITRSVVKTRCPNAGWLLCSRVCSGNSDGQFWHHRLGETSGLACCVSDQWAYILKHACLYASRCFC